MPAESAAAAVAIVIVTYNSRREIGACLTSLAAQTDPATTSTTVVDNASQDGTAAFVRTGWPQVQVIDAGSNLGFSRANNIGIVATTSEHVLLLNPDTVVRAGAVQTLVHALESQPDAAVAGPRLVDEHGRAELSFGPSISPWGELLQRTVLALYERRVAAVVGHVERVTKTAGQRSWVSGACLLIRRHDLEAVGLLDERFVMYTEDVDLCLAVRRQRGRAVIFVPGAEVVHLRGRSARRNPAAERMRRQSQLAYYEKHLPGWAGLLKLYLRLTGKLTT